MTISSNVTRASYVGDGVAVNFSFNNRVFASTDLAVYVDGILQTGGYQVLNLDTSSATVAFTVAPLATLPIVIVSVIPIQQLTAFKNQGRFNAEVHEDEFDRTNLRILNTQAYLDSAIRLPITESPTPENTTVPDLETRIASFFIWDNDGNIIAIKIADLLEYIGGSKTGAGDGLYSTYDGPTNTTTLHVGAGLGIVANADDIDVGAGPGLTAIPGEVAVGAGTAITVAADTVNVDVAALLPLITTGLAGLGLIDNGGQIDVGAGLGITVNADSVQISAPYITILDNADASNVGKNNLVPNGTDLNTITITGATYCLAGALNNPNVADGMLFTVGGDANNTAQMFTQLQNTGDFVRVYYRNQVAGVWQTWQQSVHTGNVLLVLNASYISFVDDGTSTPQYNNVQDALAAALTAIGTRFNPATSILTATDVQVAIEQIVSVLEFITSGLQFEGVWNADTNQPPITTYTPNNGDFYIVSVAGTTDLGGPDPAGDPLDNWVVADIAIYDAVAGDNGYIGWNRRPVLGIPTHAAVTAFDDVNYVLSFPTDPSPPQFVQTALDKVWPFAKQTLDSNVGRPIYAGVADYANLLPAQFNTSNAAATGHPDTAEKVSLITGFTDTADTYGLIALTATGGATRAFFRHVDAGVLQPWQETYLLTAPRTKANVDMILDNADYSNVGKTNPPTSVDLNNENRAGFYRTQNTTLNVPLLTSSDGYGNVLVVSYSDNDVLQVWTANYGSDFAPKMRKKAGGTWGDWGDIFASDTRTSKEANTILDNQDSGKWGSGAGPELADCNLAIKSGRYAVQGAAANLPPNNQSGSTSPMYVVEVFESRIIQFYCNHSANKVSIRSSNDGIAFTPWKELSTTADLAAYLPLTGGTLTGQNALLRMEAIAPQATCYVQFDTDLGAQRGYLGYPTASDDLYVKSTLGDLNVESPTSVNVTVPEINTNALLKMSKGGDIITDAAGSRIIHDGAETVFGHTLKSTTVRGADFVNLDAVTSIALNAPTVNVQRIVSDNTSLDNSSAGGWGSNANSAILIETSAATSAYWYFRQYNDTGVLSGGLQTLGNGSEMRLSVGTSLTPFRFNNAGAFYANGDITAFSGQSYQLHPNIDGTGKTTAYDLIEHLLEKIEDMETKLHDAGVVGF